MKDTDLCGNRLEIVVPNAYELAINDKEGFIKIRRNGFGASDSAIYLGVNKWTTVEQLIEQKLAEGITQEEIEVGEKEAVRKGADLEPLILDKFSKWSGFELTKPDAMYRMIEHPQLTINFDGVTQMGDQYIPVEAKYVSVYANKYWDRSKAIDEVYNGSPRVCGGAGIVDHIEQEGMLYGIPAYYYTQVQQQLLALNAPFGYLAALFDKGWELKVFKIYADTFVQQNLISTSRELWNIIEERRHGKKQ